MISRREFIVGSVAVAVTSSAVGKLAPKPESILVNDIHSQLNSTRVLEIREPRSLGEVRMIVRTARKERTAMPAAGGRHARGGQQFGTDTLPFEIRELNRVLHVDRERGIR